MSWSLQVLFGSAGLTIGPNALGGVSATVYNNQMHVCYRDAAGNIQDVWYDGTGHWQPQQLTGLGGLTPGGAANGDPKVVRYDDQMHVCYRDTSGAIQDAWYDGATDHWAVQPLTGTGALTAGPATVSDPSVIVYNNQMHVCYRDALGNIQDAWYDGAGHWQPQQLTGASGVSGGPSASTNPSMVSYNNQMHICYCDASGNLQDAWYDGAVGHWKWQSLTGTSALTPGPSSVGQLSTVIYNDQMHVCYPDVDGNIQDVWYDGLGHWSVQQLNGSGGGRGLTSGPLIDANPVAAIFNNQMHVCYQDVTGLIEDVWYDGDGHWQAQQLTGAGGLTSGPTVAGDPAVVVYDGQMHVCYRDASGEIYDAWYADAPSTAATLSLNEQFQQQSNWCWVATTVSITLYYEINRQLTQCQLADHQLGLSSCCAAPQGWSLQSLVGINSLTGGPDIAGDPASVDYDNQMHVCFLDWGGNIQDAWYNDATGSWAVQRLTGSGGLTAGSAAVGAPSVAAYNNQMHVCYRDIFGNIQDAWYDGAGHWQPQQLTTDGAASGDPKVVTYNDQMHVCYRDTTNMLQDAWYDGASNRWAVQPLTGSSGVAGGPGAIGDPSPAVYSGQMHVCYRDAAGNIQDAWFDGSGHWQPQQLTGAGGISGGPASATDPSVVSYGNQMHVCYFDASGNVQDAWYDGAAGHWKWQILTGSSGLLPGGPSASGRISVAVYNNQMHVCYQDTTGDIQDVWYDGSGNWAIQQVNGAGGLTSGPLAAGSPVALTYADQMHVSYRDKSGSIQDAWYSGRICNVTNYPDNALKYTGYYDDEQNNPLALGDIIKQISLGRPISIRIAWTGGGAHNPAIDGYDTSGPGDPTIDVEDPIYGHSVQDFNSFASTYHGGAAWTDTYLTI